MRDSRIRGKGLGVGIDCGTIRQEFCYNRTDENIFLHRVCGVLSFRLRRGGGNAPSTETPTEPPPPTCGVNEVANGRNCVCKTGFVDIDDGNGCVAMMICGANEDYVPSTNSCDCIQGYERNGDNCELSQLDPSQTQTCPDGSQISVDETCPVQMQTCPDGSQIPIAETCPPQTQTCPDGSQIPIAETCPSQTSDCTDFRVRNADGECTYDTPEYQANLGLALIDAEYAYRRGYHGQGVTVAVADTGTFGMHEDLAGNVIEPFLTLEGVPDDERQQHTRFEREFFGGHGTQIAGIIGAVRNGITAHGVAPSVVLLPIDVLDIGVNDESEVYVNYLKENDVQIRNESYGRSIPSEVVPSAESLMKIDEFVEIAKERYFNRYAQSEIVIVKSAGNDYRNGGLHPISPNVDGYYPFFHPELEDNFLLVVATDGAREILNSSNACGETQEWCIANYGGRGWRPNYARRILDIPDANREFCGPGTVVMNPDNTNGA